MNPSTLDADAYGAGLGPCDRTDRGASRSFSVTPGKARGRQRRGPVGPPQRVARTGASRMMNLEEYWWALPASELQSGMAQVQRLSVEEQQSLASPTESRLQKHGQARFCGWQRQHHRLVSVGCNSRTALAGPWTMLFLQPGGLVLAQPGHFTGISSDHHDAVTAPFTVLHLLAQATSKAR